MATRPGTPRNPASAPKVCLVAPADRGRLYAKILVRAGISYEPFSDIDALVAGESGGEILAIWTDSPGSGLSRLLDTLGQRFPDAAVVLLCSSLNQRAARTALVAGVAGIVIDGLCTATLVPCISAVMAGQTCIPRTFAREVVPPALSSREKQVLGMVVMGYMNGQIAERLYLAESTVKSHLSSAFSKLGVRSRNEAVSLILDPSQGLGMGILGLGGEPISP